MIIICVYIIPIIRCKLVNVTIITKYLIEKPQCLLGFYTEHRGFLSSSSRADECPPNNQSHQWIVTASRSLLSLDSYESVLTLHYYSSPLCYYGIRGWLAFCGLEGTRTLHRCAFRHSAEIYVTAKHLSHSCSTFRGGY
jgi:hypothetical protein